MSIFGNNYPRLDFYYLFAVVTSTPRSEHIPFQ